MMGDGSWGWVMDPGTFLGINLCSSWRKEGKKPPEQDYPARFSHHFLAPEQFLPPPLKGYNFITDILFNSIFLTGGAGGGGPHIGVWRWGSRYPPPSPAPWGGSGPVPIQWGGPSAPQLLWGGGWGPAPRSFGLVSCVCVPRAPPRCGSGPLFCTMSPCSSLDK